MKIERIEKEPSTSGMVLVFGWLVVAVIAALNMGCSGGRIYLGAEMVDTISRNEKTTAACLFNCDRGAK